MTIDAHTATNLEDMFGDLSIDDPLLDVGSKAAERVKFKPWFDDGHMLETVIWLATVTNPSIDNEPGTHKHKAFINLLKLIQLECARDPWWNSRIGWFIWFMACYSRYDSYYPLQWCYHYDPLNHYRVGEPIRPPELCRVMKDDPLNIKGECFVHPRWYMEGGEIEQYLKSDGKEIDGGDTNGKM